ncbi:MAG: hypothetical protein AB1646_26200 [Thermodesulfobacteriota bacterium]
MSLRVNAFWAGKIRMIWFTLAMIPVVVITGLLAIGALVACSPLTLYARLTGKHLKDPRRKDLHEAGV